MKCCGPVQKKKNKNTAATYKKTGHTFSGAKETNGKMRMQKLFGKFLDDDNYTYKAFGERDFIA